MKIVIVGDGKVGLAITAQLSREGHDLVVIDSNPNVLERSVEEFDVMVVHGNGASVTVLREAEVEVADLLIAATSADEINILTCILAKKLGTKHTIARVRNPEYAEQLVMLREELGLSMTINPELAAAREAYHLLQFPAFLQRESFAKGRVEIVELRVDKDSRLRDVPLNKLYSIVSVKVLVCAVERGGEALIPDGDFVLREKDRVHVTAASTDLVKLVRNLRIETHKVHSVMMIGGSRIAFYLAKMLVSSGVTVKIIEKNQERCVELANQLPEAMIIRGDGSQQRLLHEEGIKETDALVTLTHLDEENIFLSLYGSHVGVPKVITKISQTEYDDVIGDMGIESVITPKILCATDVVRYVRAMTDTAGGAIVAMHELVNGKVAAIEFFATAGTRHLGEPLTDTPIRKHFLIACIIRKGRTVIPRGSDCIREGDAVIVVTSSERVVVGINEIFED